MQPNSQIAKLAKYLDIWLFGCVQKTCSCGVSLKRTFKMFSSLADHHPQNNLFNPPPLFGSLFMSLWMKVECVNIYICLSVCLSIFLPVYLRVSVINHKFPFTARGSYGNWYKAPSPPPPPAPQGWWLNALLAIIIGDNSCSASCKTHFHSNKAFQHCRLDTTRWPRDLGRQRQSQNDATLISLPRPRALSVEGVAGDVSHNHLRWRAQWWKWWW